MKKTVSWSLVLAILWLLFTLALVSWWISVFNTFLTSLSEYSNIDIAQIEKMKNMVFWEGSSLLALVCAGALPMIYLIYRERKRSGQFRQFFASFTHDLKTAMASLRLQSECLLDDLGDRARASDQKLLKGILKDTGRLQLQLENSLMMANIRKENLYIENLSISAIVERLRLRWPQLTIQLDKEELVRADQQALESVFNNLCQNSMVHGSAGKMSISVSGDEVVILRVADDGNGFTGDFSKLTKPFLRHGRTSGSGLGLFLSHQLLQGMSGDLAVEDVDTGFMVVLSLPKGVS